MTKLLLPGHPGKYEVSDVSVPAGTLVEIVVPPGFYWRGLADGRIEVLPRLWRRITRRLTGKWTGFGW